MPARCQGSHLKAKNGRLAQNKQHAVQHASSRLGDGQSCHDALSCCKMLS